MPARPADADLLDSAELARRLGKSERWLRDFEPAQRYARLLGRTKVWTEEDYRRIKEALPCPSSSSPRAKAKPRTGRCAGPTSGSLWTEARSLLTAARQKSSARNGKRRSSAASSPSADRQPS